MAERRRYTKHQKLSAVIAADMLGVVAASEQTGIPHQTVSYWLDQPEFGEYRRKAREDLVEEIGIVAHLAWQRVAEALRSGSLEPRDALFAADKATTLLQLVSGQATDRVETMVAESMTDHEREQLKLIISEAVDAVAVEA